MSIPPYSCLALPKQFDCENLRLIFLSVHKRNLLDLLVLLFMIENFQESNYHYFKMAPYIHLCVSNVTLLRKLISNAKVIIQNISIIIIMIGRGVVYVFCSFINNYEINTIIMFLPPLKIICTFSFPLRFVVLYFVLLCMCIYYCHVHGLLVFHCAIAITCTLQSLCFTLYDIMFSLPVY